MVKVQKAVQRSYERVFFCDREYDVKSPCGKVVVEAEEVQRGECKRRWTVRGKMAYGGDGLSAEGMEFYNGYKWFYRW